MKYDEVFDRIGGFGRYQILNFALLTAVAGFTGFHILSPVFLVNIPDYRCTKPGNTIENVTLKRCHVIFKNGSSPTCNSWTYDRTYFTETIATEFNLVCDKRYLPIAIGQATFAGILVGALLSGIFSDKIGRRPTLLSGIVILCIFSMGLAWLEDAISVAVFRFFQGYACSCIWMTSFVMCIELVSPRYRAHTGIIIEYGWTASIVLLPGLAFFLHQWSWRYLEALLGAPCLLFLVYFLCIPESTRWLLSQGKIEETRAELVKIAQFNKCELSEDEIKKLVDRIKLEKTEGVLTSIRYLITSRLMIKRTLILCSNWFAVAMVYWSLSLGSGNLPGSIYLTTFLNNIIELPAYILCHVTINRFGRKKIYVICVLLSALFLILFVPVRVHKVNGLVITFAVLGKLFNSAAFGILFVWTSELFPTVLRNISLGSCSCVARIGGILAPLLAQMSIYMRGLAGQIVPYIIFAIISAVAGFLALLLSETLGQPLPEQVLDCTEDSCAERSVCRDSRTRGKTNTWYGSAGNVTSERQLQPGTVATIASYETSV